MKKATYTGAEQPSSSASSVLRDVEKLQTPKPATMQMISGWMSVTPKALVVTVSRRKIDQPMPSTSSWKTRMCMRRSRPKRTDCSSALRWMRRFLASESLSRSARWSSTYAHETNLVRVDVIRCSAAPPSVGPTRLRRRAAASSSSAPCECAGVRRGAPRSSSESPHASSAPPANERTSCSTKKPMIAARSVESASLPSASSACMTCETASIATVKSTMTTTSITTVTASITVVNGPRACSSEMSAIAEAGERATEIVDWRKAMPRRSPSGMPRW